MIKFCGVMKPAPLAAAGAAIYPDMERATRAMGRYTQHMIRRRKRA